MAANIYSIACVQTALHTDGQHNPACNSDQVWGKGRATLTCRRRWSGLGVRAACRRCRDWRWRPRIHPSRARGKSRRIPDTCAAMEIVDRCVMACVPRETLLLRKFMTSCGGKMRTTQEAHKWHLVHLESAASHQAAAAAALAPPLDHLQECRGDSVCAAGRRAVTGVVWLKGCETPPREAVPPQRQRHALSACLAGMQSCMGRQRRLEHSG